MKRTVKHTSSLYAFLEATGVLSMGDTTAIADAKKEYYKLYKKNWNKQKRQESTSYTILYTHKEAIVVQQSADKHNTSPTNYIKQASLSDRFMIDIRKVGELRASLFKAHDFITHHIAGVAIPDHIGTVLLQTIEELETQIRSLIKPN